MHTDRWLGGISLRPSCSECAPPGRRAHRNRLGENVLARSEYQRRALRHGRVDRRLQRLALALRVRGVRPSLRTHRPISCAPNRPNEAQHPGTCCAAHTGTSEPAMVSVDRGRAANTFDGASAGGTASAGPTRWIIPLAFPTAFHLTSTAPPCRTIEAPDAAWCTTVDGCFWRSIFHACSRCAGARQHGMCA